jgi:acetate kinase
LYEKSNIPTKLAPYAKEYHDAVEHFQRTKIVIAAVKHYIEEVKKVTPIHESYGAEVLEYFRNMVSAFFRKLVFRLFSTY